MCPLLHNDPHPNVHHILLHLGNSCTHLKQFLSYVDVQTKIFDLTSNTPSLGWVQKQIDQQVLENFRYIFLLTSCIVCIVFATGAIPFVRESRVFRFVTRATAISVTCCLCWSRCEDHSKQGHCNNIYLKYIK